MLSTDKNGWSDSGPFLNRKKILLGHGYRNYYIGRKLNTAIRLFMCASHPHFSLWFSLCHPFYIWTTLVAVLLPPWNAAVLVSSAWGSCKNGRAGCAVWGFYFLPRLYLDCNGSSMCVYTCVKTYWILRLKKMYLIVIIPQFNYSTINWFKIIMLQSDY